MVANWNRVIGDISPEDFHQNGAFFAFIQHLKSMNFDELIALELHQVGHFLKIWEQQLNEENTCSHIYGDLLPIDLGELFLQTPKLSGVLYLSHNHVISEAFFQENPQNLQHLTDRVIHPIIQKQLPEWKDLTFSFPRRYRFSGFYNSWGFIRVERKDVQGNGCGIILSITTLDAEVMTMMKKQHYEHLGDLYNQAWDGAIHDYVHHIALYTNPSFGIGKVSPMSLVNEHSVIDKWGADMLDTFNYEYWAHRTHRLITGNMMGEGDKQQLISKAKKYFTEVYAFLQILLKENSPSYVQRVSNYLVNIYLWPLHIIIHPFDLKFEELTEEINRLQVDYDTNIPEEIDKMLQIIKQQAIPPNEPRSVALNETIKKLQLREKMQTSRDSITWYDVMRLNTDSLVQRGMYEGWFHNHDIFYQNQPISPNKAALHMLTALKQTFSSFEKKSHSIQSYCLKGIVP
ncbi:MULTISPECIES: hypothetical protein [Parachlamydia]|uniref:hypothetical protein n=1 Tax=Parachlamydia TaxID=83551 RepID=UPI0024E22F2C|nr:hypothetical protein [Parachlamydia acanthamoebae]